MIGGEGSTELVRTAPLCWSQHWQWMNDSPQATRDRPPASYTLTPKLPGGQLSTEQFRGALRHVVERYEALRTVYRIGDDSLPVQIVLAPDEPLVVLTSAEESFESAKQKAREAVNLVDGPIVTAAVAIEDGKVIEAIVVIALIALDGAALGIVQRHLDKTLAGHMSVSGESTGQTPVGVALDQSGERTARLNERARSHWSAMFARAPHSTLPFYWLPSRPDLTSLDTRLTSARLAVRIEAAAMRYRVPPSTVYLSVVSSLLALWTKHDSVVLASAVSNRWSAEMHSSVGRFATLPSLHVDLAGNPVFSDIVRRSRAAASQAQRFGYHDVGGLCMESARRSVDRGSLFVTAVYLNFHDYDFGSGASEGGPQEEPFISQRPDTWRTQNLQIDVFPRGEQATVRLLAPKPLLGQEEARRFLSTLVRLLDAVAEQDDLSLSDLAGLVTLPEYWRGPRWVSHCCSWISLDDIDELLARTGAIEAVGTFADGMETDHSRPLVSYVASSDPHLTADLVRERMRGLVSHLPTARVPDRIELCNAVPADITDVSEWQAMPVVPRELERGLNRPTAQAEEALAAAFAATHPGRQWRSSDSYAQASGEFLRIPAMLEHFDRLGWGGVRFSGLIGMAPLRTLAEGAVFNR